MLILPSGENRGQSNYPDEVRIPRSPGRITSVMATMKKLLLLSLICVPLSAAISAQEWRTICREERKPDPESDRDTLINIEHGITHGIQINNSSMVNAVFSNEFSGVTWYGEIINKAAQIRLIQTSPVSYQFVRSSNIQVKLYRDLATVSSLRTERGSSQGRAISRQFRVLRVYMNTPAGWRVIAQQETQLPTELTH